MIETFLLGVVATAIGSIIASIIYVRIPPEIKHWSVRQWWILYKKQREDKTLANKDKKEWEQYYSFATRDHNPPPKYSSKVETTNSIVKQCYSHDVPREVARNIVDKTKSMSNIDLAEYAFGEIENYGGTCFEYCEYSITKEPIGYYDAEYTIYKDGQSIRRKFSTGSEKNGKLIPARYV